MTTTTFSPPRVKPVSNFLFYLLTGVFGVSLIYLLTFFVISSWSDSQINNALNIRQAGFSKYEMVIGDETVVPLSKKQWEAIVAFEDCDWLPEEQQEFVYEGYAKALEQYPSRIYLHIWSADESGTVGNLFETSILLALAAVLGYFVLICTLIYRGWQTIQPLKQMDCPANLNIPAPKKGTGYLTRLVKAGKLLSSRYGIPYTGPSTLLVTLSSIVSLWILLTQRLDFSFGSINWYVDLFCMSLLLVLWPLLGLKLQRMIRSLSAAQPVEPPAEEIPQ